MGLHWLLAKTEGFYLTSPDADVRRHTAEYLRALAELCARFGRADLVLGSPQQRNLLAGRVAMKDAEAYAAEVLHAAVPACCTACDVTIAARAARPRRGQLPADGRAAIDWSKLVDSPHCRLHLDVKAMASEAEPIADEHPRQPRVARPLPRQRPEPARPRHGRSRLRADLCRPPGDQLPGLGIGRGIQVRAQPRRNRARSIEYMKKTLASVE